MQTLCCLAYSHFESHWSPEPCEKESKRMKSIDKSFVNVHLDRIPKAELHLRLELCQLERKIKIFQIVLIPCMDKFFTEIEVDIHLIEFLS